MTGFLEKLKRNRVWSIAVFVENGGFSFLEEFKEPRFVLDSKKVRSRYKHVHTYADPFLFCYNDELYLFFELQAVGRPGKIRALKTRDLLTFEDAGEVLRAPFHLSFPFVFRDGNDIFLMPESLETNEVALYRFVEFPNKVVKERVLLHGSFKDSSLIRHNGTWFFFTTGGNGLELFYTDDIREGHLIPHPCNPITSDPRYSQCGGSLIELNGEMYRVAQDGSGEYGRNISILRVTELSKLAYSEEVVVNDYFALQHTWNSRGGHHLSIADFKGKRVCAVDGKQDDLLLNKFLAPFYTYLRPLLRPTFEANGQHHR